MGHRIKSASLLADLVMSDGHGTLADSETHHKCGGKQCPVVMQSFCRGWFVYELKKLLKVSIPAVSTELLCSLILSITDVWLLLTTSMPCHGPVLVSVVPEHALPVHPTLVFSVLPGPPP